MSLKILLFVFLGGGMGSISRYLISKGFSSEWNIGTFLANVLGCIAIGLLVGLYRKNILTQEVFFFLSIGFCGGLTTFSTFAFELVDFLKQDKLIPCIMYLSISILVGISCVYIGLKCSELNFFKNA